MGRDSSMTKEEKTLRLHEEISVDGPFRRSVLALFVQMLCLSRMGQSALWWIETLSGETRSLFGRIRTLHGRRRGSNGVCCGPLYEQESSGHLVL
jgi:hypothetical protein